MRVINQVLEFSNVYNQEVLVVTSSTMGYGQEIEVTEGTKESFIEEMNGWMAKSIEDFEDENEFFDAYVRGLKEDDDIRIYSIVVYRGSERFIIDLEDIYDSE